MELNKRLQPLKVSDDLLMRLIHLPTTALFRARVTALCLAALLAGCLPIFATQAQQPSASLASAKTPAEPDKMLLEAKQMVYDRDTNVVSAQGDVRIYYQGRTLLADKVTYDRNVNHVYASGNVKMTETDGTVTYSDNLELTNNFKDGFIDSLKADTKDKTYFTAARGERIDGDTLKLDSGTYTACEACKEDPSKPRFWQVRAKKIIYKREEHTVYYEDAYFDFYGMPIAYLPYFSGPDSTVTRQSGFLTPHYTFKSTLGPGVTIPYFWALAPNYDLTFSPTYFSRQGFLGDVEWRHRLENGAYSVRAAGIFQQDSDVYSKAPLGPQNRTFRGAIESEGDFNINPQWRFGWRITSLSDKWFMTDYRMQQAGALSNNFLQEAISTVYLRGQSDRSLFDLRGYYFKGMSSYDFQKQLPVVWPVLDYNKAIDIDPAKSMGIGGEVTIDSNFTHLTREAAAYQSAGIRQLDRQYSLYDVCASPSGQGYVPGYNRSNCLLRGIGGDFSRATLNLDWRRKFIDPLGQVWTPLAFAHANGEWLDLNYGHNYYTVQNSTGLPMSNAYQSAFFNDHPYSSMGQVMPGGGIDYRYPLLIEGPFGNQIFEPIGQIIARTNEHSRRPLANEDAQSLVFDDSNLFDVSKFSGNDRFEGGLRSNYGAQYTMNFPNNGYVNMLAGQSIQIAGRNSYITADAANVGLDSGLDKARSDYVGRMVISPAIGYSVIAKTRLDTDTLALRRLDLQSSANWTSTFSTAVQYARYMAQPQIGYEKRREGLATAANYKFLDHYFVNGNVVFSMSRYLYLGNIGTNNRRWTVASTGLSVGYEDDCTTLSLLYTSGLQDTSTTVHSRNTTMMVELKMRTLGDTKFNPGL